MRFPFPRIGRVGGDMHLDPGTCARWCIGGVERTLAETHWAPHTELGQGHSGPSGLEDVSLTLIQKSKL